VEILGKHFEKNMIVVVDIGYTLSYISPATIKKCGIRKDKQNKD